jgi:hypothetical protein
MKVLSFIQSFLIIFALVFIVSGLVSFLYSLVVHSHGTIDWESSFRLAIIFGIALPLRSAEKNDNPRRTGSEAKHGAAAGTGTRTPGGGRDGMQGDPGIFT